MEEDRPGVKHTNDMEGFLAQLYDLTHSIDAVENDIDEIVGLRNKIVRLDPRVDVGQVSLRADLDALSALTTQTGKGIVAIETWLTALHKWSKQLKAYVKAGQAGETLKEVGEVKYHLATAKLDFANAMERIREGAWKEQERRERTRIWMAAHIREREPDIDDRDVKGLLKAAELGAADGVAKSHVTSYAGLWALQNPFTELAELTNGMRFLHDDLDREIVNDATGKSARKRTINLNGPPPASAKKSKKKSSKKAASQRTAPFTQIPASYGFFGSRGSLLSGTHPRNFPQDETAFDRKMRLLEAEQFATEKDLEYGFARQAQQERINRRKKLIIALLLVLIAALIVLIVLSTMKVPDQQVSWVTGGRPDVDNTSGGDTEALPPIATQVLSQTASSPIVPEEITSAAQSVPTMQRSTQVTQEAQTSYVPRLPGAAQDS
ncbi:hypothetical protein Rhopal_004745-T1 [Rhodotorula paludigena]|uniref:Uncharacterized protein n=1 Tax=Rhodotorula paludigena TaxID=86838 RepID=A0AAV5GQS2_9BASI|nr:hypothetical protein Rhopal_004745-T1 [Rhodotorula paludigena]